MKKTLRPTMLIGIAAAALMLVLVILNFVPYWLYQGQSVSLGGYIWRPYEHSDFTNLFKSYFGKSFKVTLLFALPLALTLIANAAGTVLCTIRSAKVSSYLLPIASGILGLSALLMTPAFKLSGLWIAHVILYALVLLLGIVGIIVAGRKK